MSAEILTLPAVLQQASAFSWGYMNSVQVNTSPSGANSRTHELPGFRWVCELTYAALTAAEAAELRVLLVKLRGQANRLKLFDFGHPTPSGTIAGTTPTLSAGIAYGGDTARVSAVSGKTVKKGDYFLFDQTGQVVMALEDATSAGSYCEFDFGPPARAAVTSGTSVIIDRPSALFIPQDSRVLWGYDPANQIRDFRMSFVEIWST